jgi:hypothetical protein
LPATGDSADQAGDEDSALTPKPVVEGSGEPAAKKGATHIRCTVREASEPGRAWVIAGNLKLFVVKELGAIDNGLV